MKQNEMIQKTMIQRKTKLPELLAPAGSFEHLKAAIKAGADAVYMGGQQFGARAYADNFTGEKLVEALHYAHFYDRRLYLTVNTLMKEKEITERLYDFLQPFYEEGLDGVIVQDVGAAAFIRKNFPGMEIHGSTQMTITDVYGARAAARLGMNRVVPARELSLSEIRRMKEEAGLDIEVFIHGALCYCYSGQCLLSSRYGGRSGNRGRCAQPCRLPYRVMERDSRSSAGAHLLSPKDLCAISWLPSLIEAGVDSLKIEGRMKNVEYVAGVTAIYRKYLDLYREMGEEDLSLDKKQEHRQRKWKISKKDYEALEELYSRSGFTDGYWNRHNGSEMMATIHPRNLGRKIGWVRQVRRGQIAVELDRGTILHPKDILILPLPGQEEMALTVPEHLRKDDRRIILNVPGTKVLRAGMEIYRRKNDSLSSWIENDILKKEIKYPVQGKIIVRIGNSSELLLRCRGEEILVLGKAAEPSAKRPVTEEDIHRQMNKTGDVPFYLEDLDADLEENAFLPMSAVKELRQTGFRMLQEQMERRACRSVSEEKNKRDRKISLQSEEKSDTVISLNNNKKFDDFHADKKKMAVVYDKKIAEFCLSHPFFNSICLPLDFWAEEDSLSFAAQICRQGKNAYLSLPLILREDEAAADSRSELSVVCRSRLWSGIYAHTMGQAQFLWEMEDRTAPVYAASSFYQWNHFSLAETKRIFGIAGAELPLELSGGECREMLANRQKDVAVECSVYGRIPLMKSAQCIKKTRGGCDRRQEVLFLEDKKKRRLPVVSHCRYCYNTIWSDTPRNLLGEEEGAFVRGLDAVIFHFFLDDERSAREAVLDYERWEKNGFGPAKGKEPDAYWKYGIE